MLNKKMSLGLAMTSLVFLATACDPLISQDPKDFFKNGKFPKQLEWIRSQMRELSQKEKDQIVARTEADQKRTDLLKVAVIDSGVDIAHEDLIKQISYRVENGKIVGAGYDIMGDGKFGSHTLVNPVLFAFGAKAIQGGKIVEPVDSPLGLLKKINDRFRELVITGIQADPDLSKSLFADLKAETFTVLGLNSYRFDLDKEDFEERYQERKKNGELYGKELRPSKQNPTLENPILKGWGVMGLDQAPDALNFVGSIEHGNKFVNLVSDAFTKLDLEFEYSKQMEQFNRFVLKLENPSEEPLASDLEKTPDKLKDAMLYVVHGIDLYDPIATIDRLLRQSRKSEGLDFSEEFLNFYQRQVNDLDQLLKEPAVPESQKRILEKSKSELKTLYSIVKSLIDLKNDPVAYKTMRSRLRRSIIRNNHPYIDAESAKNKHGTHVSGIIAAQDPNIRIVPIRVTTQTIALSPSRQTEINNEFLTQFKEFMASPYYQPLKELIAQEYGHLKISDQTILREVSSYLKGNGLNSVFIKDVIEAVEAAGKEQAKLANVSLGTTFKKNFQLDKKAASMAEDLFSEFARFKIGQAIKEKAPGTLFMIATGNDGGWIDGVSKSAFPVGITSLRMMKLTEAKKAPAAPNNTTRNVLAVASINPNGTLTPFTNILIDPNIPQIFSTGEEIMSTVPNKSGDAAFEIVRAKLQNMTKLVLKMSQLQTEVANNKSIVDKLESSLTNAADGLTLMQLSRSLATLVDLEAPVGRESMSGTSMATPTVTGILAKYLLQKMKTNGISSAQAYTHPQMQPDVVISEVMAMSKANKLTPVFTVQMLIDGIKSWKKAPQQRVQAQRIRFLTRPRCEAVYQF